MTFDRSKTTLFRCLTHAFQYTGGVPTEIWFDNKTIVDCSRSQFSKVVFNERFRPQTKGKVEFLACTTNGFVYLSNFLFYKINGILIRKIAY